MALNIPVLLLSGLVLAPLAEAAEFNHVQIENSRIGFVFKQMNVPVSGRLAKFAVELSFDPAQPTLGKAEFKINPSDIDAGSEEANAELSQKDWFYAQTFPQATFVSNAIKALGGNRFAVMGKMSIKGHTKDISAEFTYGTDKNTAVFDGSFTLQRADFGIGEGAWADFNIVANEVLIQFHLVADTGQ